MTHRVLIEFEHMIPLASVEAAARRRLRYMQSGYPAVLEWKVRLQSFGLAGSQLARVQVTASAQTAAGIVKACGDDHEPLGALHLAFNNLEYELEAGHRAALARAAAWVQKVRQSVARRAGLQ